MQTGLSENIEGILLVDKPKGKTSFALVATLRRILKVQKIGHAGTLDPFATGVMVMLIGRNYTRRSDEFLCNEKAYKAIAHLGVATDTYDHEGQVTATSDLKPSMQEIEAALAHFQGEILQIPPMFSAKKIGGKKLYELARKGKEIERAPVAIKVVTKLIHYNYPEITFEVTCSKGTYIRSIAHDLGQILGTGAHLSSLERTRSGSFCLEQCLEGTVLFDNTCDKETISKKIMQL